MKVLVITVARYGNEQTKFKVYADKAGEGGASDLPHYATVVDGIGEALNMAAYHNVDAVCVEGGGGLGVSFADDLRRAGLPVVLTR